MGARKLARAAMAAVLGLALAAAGQLQDPGGSSDISMDIGIFRSDRRFAAEPDPEPRKSPGGIGLHAWGSWIAPQDVPADLRARPYRTATQLILDLDSDGRASRCRIVAPSTEPRLDALACELLRSRGRFEPLYFGARAPGVRQMADGGHLGGAGCRRPCRTRPQRASGRRDAATDVRIGGL